VPWDCQACKTTIATDEEIVCPKCGTGKNAWTLVANKTRTFAVTARVKAKYYRATGDKVLKKDEADYPSFPLEEVSEAFSVEKDAIRQLAHYDHVPAPDQILVVRLWPKKTGEIEVGLTPEFETKELAEETFPVERPAEEYETIDVRFLLVHGEGDLTEEEKQIPTVDGVIDVTDAVASGHAPTLGVRALTRKRKPLPICSGMRAFIMSL
jgi:hypothetical protein